MRLKIARSLGRESQVALVVVGWTPSPIYTHRTAAGYKRDDEDKDHLRELHAATQNTKKFNVSSREDAA